MKKSLNSSNELPSAISYPPSDHLPKTPNPNKGHEQVYLRNLKNKPQSLDPNLADFDITSYENATMNCKKTTNTDFNPHYYCQCEEPECTRETSYLDETLHYSRSLSTNAPNTPNSSSSLKVLKAVPDYNNNFIDQSEIESMTEMVMSIKTDKGKAVNTKFDSPVFSATKWIVVNEVNEDLPTQRNDKTNSNLDDSSDLDNRINCLQDEFTKSYEKEVAVVEKSITLDEVEKLKEINKLYRWWISDLYEQNEVFSNTFEEFQKSSQKDSEEFRDELCSLEKKVKEFHSAKSHWKAKADGLGYENSRNCKTIQTLNEEIVEFKVHDREMHSQVKQLEKDVESLTLLITRLRDGGVWDLEGLNMSTVVFMKIFGGHQNLFGKKVECNNADIQHDKLDQMREDKQIMAKELEVYRAKLFSSERKMQKLKIELQSINSRIEFAKKEEASRRRRIADLHSGERALLEGRCDTCEDNFVKL